MIVEEEVYLEHYGRRGMKWGQRHNKTISKADKINNYKKLKRGAVISAGILAAGGVATIIAVRHRNLAKTVSGQAKVNNLLNHTFVTDSKGRTSKYGELAVKQFFPKDALTFAANSKGSVTRVKDAFR